MIILCECGAKMELDMVEAVAFFNGQSAAFWKRHGHAPGRVTYWCECGEQHRSGPLRHPAGPKIMMATDLVWYAKHQGCLFRGRSN
jgi:hypothetical protein